MKRKVITITLVIVFLSVIYSLYIVLAPQSYPVAKFSKRPGTQYWQLSTGSNIGYTHIQAKGSLRNIPIIYLHGGPGGIIKDYVIQTLQPLAKEGFSLYFYDQLGSGHSNRLDNIGAYSLQRHCRDLAQIIGQLQAKKVILIGHSWGAMLATQYAAKHAHKIHQMILSNPGPFVPTRQALATMKSPDSLQLRPPTFSNKQGNEKAYKLRNRVVWYVAQAFHKKLASDQEADDFFTYLSQQVNKSTLRNPSKLGKLAGGRGYYAHIMTLKSLRNAADHRPLIQKAYIPTLVIKGQYDNQKWGFTQEYLTLLKDSHLKVIKNVGHDIAREKPKVYLQVIKEFLKKTSVVQQNNTQ